MSVKDTLNDQFLLPSMGDYYFDCLDHKWYGKLDEDLDNMLDVKRGNRFSGMTNDVATKYYQCDPPDIGYNSKYMSYTIGVAVSDKAEVDDYIGNIRVVDGDTLVLYANDLQPGNDEENKKFVAAMTKGTKMELSNPSGPRDRHLTGGCIGLRFACVDTMEIPHFEYCGDAELFNSEIANARWETTQKTFAEAWDKRDIFLVSKYCDYRQTKNGNHAYDIETDDVSDSSNAAEKLNFIKTDTVWRQYYIKDNNVYILAAEDSSGDKAKVADAGKAREIAWNAVKNAVDMRIVIDGSSINHIGSENGYTPYLRVDQSSSNRNIGKWLSFCCQQLFYNTKLINTGFATPGLDVYNRALAVVYVRLKIKDGEDPVWINLNKYIAAKTDFTDINSTMHSGDSQARNNFYSDLIDANSYEIDNVLYADAVWKQSKQFDDRPKVQKEIWMGNNSDPVSKIRASETLSFNNTDAKDTSSNNLDFLQRLNHWTVTIGDCTFFVPPEAIRCETISRGLKLPILRARGAMTKGSTKVQKVIQLDLYFNGEKGINGFPYKTKLPNGKEITYHMNGLRSLLAQFKIVPFLPIENYYINRILQIDAVSMNSISVQTVPGFPQLLKASLQMNEFEYRIYMPEIPIEEDDEFLMRNYFAKQINYEIYRWYYQRMILNGEALKDVAFMDDTYIKNTFGNKSCLVPMKFESSVIRFYIPNREHLSQMKQVKLSRLTKKSTPNNLSDNQKDVVQDFSKIFTAISECYNNTKDTGKYKKLQDLLKQKAINNIQGDPNSGKTIYLCNAEGYNAKLKGVYVNYNDEEKAYTLTEDKYSNEYAKKVSDGMIEAGKEIKSKLSELKNEKGESLCSSIEVSGGVCFDSGASPLLGYETGMTSETNKTDEAHDSMNASVIVTVKVNMSDISQDQLDSLLTQATQAQGDENLKNYSLYSAQELKNGCTLRIPITIPLKNTKTTKFKKGDITYSYPEENSKFIAMPGGDGTNDSLTDAVQTAKVNSALGMDADFLAIMQQMALDNGVGGNQKANALKAAMDYENLNSIKWDEYEFDEPIIAEDFAIGMANTFSKITLSSLNGYAPQFMGGTDMQINFSFKTKSEYIAASLRALPSIAAEYAREYRIVLPAWPLKIESELTKLFGITDVMIESVDVNTTPNYPGWYSITVSATSVDRTLRNREAMTREQLDNYTQLDIESKKTTRKFTYKQINEYLSEKELYPDLELPTIKEFNDAGFRFVRYSNPKRKYPDPDFYYTYSYLLISQIIREAVVKGISENFNKYQLNDSAGLEATSTEGGGMQAKTDDETAKQRGYKRDKDGNIIPRQTTKSNIGMNDDTSRKNQKLTDYDYDPINGNFGKTWEVSNNIKISIAEKNFISDLISYDRETIKIQEALKDDTVYQTAVLKGDTAKQKEIENSKRLELKKEQVDKNNENNSDASNTEFSGSLSILADATSLPEKTMVSNGVDPSETKTDAEEKAKKEAKEKEEAKKKEEENEKKYNNDLEYLTKNGYTKEQAEEELSKLPQYKEKFEKKKLQAEYDKELKTLTDNGKTKEQAEEELKKQDKYKTIFEEKEQKEKEEKEEKKKKKDIANGTAKEEEDKKETGQNGKSSKVDESKPAESYNSKKWVSVARKTVEVIDDILSKPIKLDGTQVELDYNKIMTGSDETEESYPALDLGPLKEIVTGDVWLGNALTNDMPTEAANATPGVIGKVAAYAAGSLLSKVDGSDYNCANVLVNQFITAAGAAMGSEAEYAPDMKNKDWKIQYGVYKGTILNSGGHKEEVNSQKRVDEFMQSKEVRKRYISDAEDLDEYKNDYEYLIENGYSEAAAKNELAKPEYITKYKNIIQENRKKYGIQSAGIIEQKAKGEQKWIALYDLVNKGIEFGIFKLRMHTANEIRNIFEDDKAVDDNSVMQLETGLYLLDPYYRNGIANLTEEEFNEIFPATDSKIYAPQEDTYKDINTDDEEYGKILRQQKAIKLYKASCIIDQRFARVAFWRVCLVWMRKLILDYVLPSFCFDIFRESIGNQKQIEQVMEAVAAKRVAKVDEGLKREYDNAKELLEKAKQKSEEAQKDTKLRDEQKKRYKKEYEDREKAYNEIEKKYNEAKNKVKSQYTESQNANRKIAETSMDFFKNNIVAVDKGKIYLIILMAILSCTNSPSEILKLLIARNMDDLEAKTKTVLTGAGANSHTNEADTLIRKYTKALVGYDLIDKDQLGKASTQTPGETMSRIFNYNNYVSCSDDMSKWLVHSYHDMVVHDARGRMARAFPTFMLILVDEGRSIKQWKLHDNFYNTSAISNMTITKSRKNPTDLAEITMANFFQTFTTEDEDLNYNYTYNISDIFDSIFNAQEYSEKLEERRTNAEPPERFKITPGARIHIRMGYGGDASRLPIMFNGIVVNVSTEDVLNITAQGDGQELAKPILLDKDASEISHADDFLPTTGITGATPKNILSGLFMTHGGFLNKTVHETSQQGTIERLWDSFGTSINPLGIYHFGDRDYQYIAGEPEPLQNIFEICDPENKEQSSILRKKGLDESDTDTTTSSFITGGGVAAGLAAGAKWLGGPVTAAAVTATKAAYNYATSPDYPMIDFDLFGKTVWDVAHIVKGIQPNYITSIAPFDFRSTFFFGKPHDYYAYSYEYQADTSTWCEKRKPFQQYHIISSMTDIMANQCEASGKEISTCAVGLYSVEGSFGTQSQKQTDPVWVDKSIYPEYQKTMYFDTKLYGKSSNSVPPVSNIVNFFGASLWNDWLDRVADDTGNVKDHHAMAQLMTKNALKESIKDMYQGPIVIIGDPTIKPYDRVTISDFFQEIHGNVEVRDVVTSLSAETGFTTAIYPDLIATLKDDGEDEIKIQNASEIVVTAVRGAVLSVAMYTGFTALRAIGAMYAEKLSPLGKIAANSKSPALSQFKDKFGHIAKQDYLKVRSTIIEKAGSAGKYARKAENYLKYGKTVKNIVQGTGVAARAGAAIAGIGASTVAAGGTVAMLASIAAPLLILAAVAGGTYMVGSLVEDWIEKQYNNRRTLALFPIKHYNKVMTAGVNGSMGLVYGSPTWSQSDLVTNILGDAEEEGFSGGVGSGLLKWGMWLLSSDECNPCVLAAQDRKNRLENAMNESKLTFAAVDSVKNSQAGLFMRTKVDPTVKRITLGTKKSEESILNAYGVCKKDGTDVSPNEIGKLPNWDKMKDVASSSKLKKYKDKKFFRLATEQDGYTKDNNSNIVDISTPAPGNPSSIISFKGMKVTNSKTKQSSYDIPFLCADALAVCESIVEYAYEMEFGTQQGRDQYQYAQDNGNSSIVLKSALRAGETSGYAGAGLCFELEASDKKTSSAMLSGLDRVKKEFEEAHNKDSRVQKEIFKSRIDNENENQVKLFITVMPALE